MKLNFYKAMGELKEKGKNTAMIFVTVDGKGMIKETFCAAGARSDENIVLLELEPAEGKGETITVIRVNELHRYFTQEELAGKSVLLRDTTGEVYLPVEIGTALEGREGKEGKNTLFPVKIKTLEESITDEKMIKALLKGLKEERGKE